MEGRGGEASGTLPLDDGQIPLAKLFLERQKDLEACLKVSIRVQDDLNANSSDTWLISLRRRLREYVLQLKIWLDDCDAGNVPSALSIIDSKTEPELYKALKALARTLQLKTRLIIPNLPRFGAAIQQNSEAWLSELQITRDPTQRFEATQGIEEVLQTLSTFLHPLQMAQALKSNTGPYVMIRSSRADLPIQGKSWIDNLPSESLASESGTDEPELEPCSKCQILFPWHMMEFHSNSCATRTNLGQDSTSEDTLKDTLSYSNSRIGEPSFASQSEYPSLKRKAIEQREELDEGALDSGLPERREMKVLEELRETKEEDSGVREGKDEQKRYGRVFSPSFRVFPPSLPSYDGPNIVDIAKSIPTSNFDESPTRYVYPRLGGGKETLRLLVVLPGKAGSRMYCRLICTDFGSLDRTRQQYEALSCASDNSPATNSIEIVESDGDAIEDIVRPNFSSTVGQQSQILHVQDNLHEALQQFRSTESDLIFWVEAICIDQNSFEEKDAHFRKMEGIFNRAENVRVWLDMKLNVRSSEVINLMRKMLDIRDFDIIINDESIAEQWYDFATIMDNPWFRRRLSVPELAFARRAAFHLGSEKIEGKDFADVVALFVMGFEDIKELCQSRSSQMTKSNNSTHRSLGEITTIRAKTLMECVSNLVRKSAAGDVLEKTLGLESVVLGLISFQIVSPLNTIKTVLSLARDADFYVDGANSYNDELTTTGKILTDFVIHCIQSSKSLDVICRHWAPAVDVGELLPTWTPPVSGSVFGDPIKDCKQRINGDSIVGPKSDRPVYNASFGFQFTVPNLGFIKTGNREQSILFVKGYCIGSVIDTSRSTDGLILKKVLELGGWQDFESNPVPDRLWRTMVADKGHTGSRPPNWYHRAATDAFQSFKTTDNISIPELLDDNKASTTMTSFLRRVEAVVCNRSFFQCEGDPQNRDAGMESLFGIGPLNSQIGDVICIIPGCTVPVVLRECSAPGTLERPAKRKKTERSGQNLFELVGECFVYGIMDGEVYQALKDHRITLKEETFDIR